MEEIEVSSDTDSGLAQSEMGREGQREPFKSR